MMSTIVQELLLFPATSHCFSKFKQLRCRDSLKMSPCNSLAYDLNQSHFGHDFIDMRHYTLQNNMI